MLPSHIKGTCRFRNRFDQSVNTLSSSLNGSSDCGLSTSESSDATVGGPIGCMRLHEAACEKCLPPVVTRCYPGCSRSTWPRSVGANSLSIQLGWGGLPLAERPRLRCDAGAPSAGRGRIWRLPRNEVGRGRRSARDDSLHSVKHAKPGSGFSRGWFLS